MNHEVHEVHEEHEEHEEHEVTVANAEYAATVIARLFAERTTTNYLSSCK